MISRTVLLMILGISLGAPPSIQKPPLPAGTPQVWEDRRGLTPSKVFWGAASVFPDPASRLPAPPFSSFERDEGNNANSPKCKLKDKNGIKWVVKFGSEVHADIAAPRLAWALGFGCVESYYVPSGTIAGITPSTPLGKVKSWIKPDGSFKNARFKRNNSDEVYPKNDKGLDLVWNLAKNPGVPPEHLSGLLIFDVLVHNWDAQPKNCKYFQKKGPGGPVDWYIVNDMGACFGLGPRPFSKYKVSDYRKEESFVKSVSNTFVELSFADAIPVQERLHQRIPLAHAQWFRNILDRLSDEDIRAAFDAAYGNPESNAAYVSGDMERIGKIDRKMSPEIAGYVSKFREKIEEFKRKVPPTT